MKALSILANFFVGLYDKMGIQKLTEYTDDEPDYGGVKYKLRHFTKFRLLCIITAIFLVLSIIFIILYAVEKSKVDDTTSSKPGSKNCGQVYCGTSACLHASLGEHSFEPFTLFSN